MVLPATLSLTPTTSPVNPVFESDFDENQTRLNVILFATESACALGDECKLSVC